MLVQLPSSGGRTLQLELQVNLIFKARIERPQFELGLSLPLLRRTKDLLPHWVFLLASFSRGLLPSISEGLGFCHLNRCLSPQQVLDLSRSRTYLPTYMEIQLPSLRRTLLPSTRALLPSTRAWWPSTRLQWRHCLTLSNRNSFPTASWLYGLSVVVIPAQLSEKIADYYMLGIMED